MSAPKLYDYGIQNEESDIRAHVGVIARTVYVFRTEEAKRIVELFSDDEKRSATQPGVKGPTGEGFPVPLCAFWELRRVHCPEFSWWYGWTRDLGTSEKGRRAVQVVRRLLRQGRLPLWIAADEAGDRSVQIAGTDVLVCCRQRIQVKCDYRAGDAPGCTGNIFLQTAERNPLGAH